MTTQEFATETAPRRVVEAEFRLPRFSEIDLQPAKKVAGEVLLTGLGLGVLLTRAVIKGVRNAHDAGREWADSDAKAGQAITQWMDGDEDAPDTSASHAVPVLPIAEYDQLAPTQIAAALATLDRGAIETVRAYEAEHSNRQTVLAAIDNRPATMS